MNTTSNSYCSVTDMELPRKKRFRAKLDHMSPEEKRERRKEKNRQAAQAARDRKRQNQDRLDEENRKLREENMKLRNIILGNGLQLPMKNTRLSSPLNQIHDSGVSEVGSHSASSPASYLPDNSKLGLHSGLLATRTMTPDSTYYTETQSPTRSEDQYIDGIIEKDNDVALVNDIQKLASYVESGSADESSLETADLIHAPLPKVRTPSAAPSSTVNSLGWTSVQLMLILLIARIHHRLSAKTNCCRKEPSKSGEIDEMDPVNCNLYDYILHTKCIDFRRAAEAIISNKSNVRQQRLVALDFVRKYLYNVNLIRLRQQQQLQQQSSCSISMRNEGCLVQAQQ